MADPHESRVSELESRLAARVVRERDSTARKLARADSQGRDREPFVCDDCLGEYTPETGATATSVCSSCGFPFRRNIEPAAPGASRVEPAPARGMSAFMVDARGLLAQMGMDPDDHRNGMVAQRLCDLYLLGKANGAPQGVEPAPADVRALADAARAFGVACEQADPATGCSEALDAAWEHLASVARRFSNGASAPVGASARHLPSMHASHLDGGGVQVQVDGLTIAVSPRWSVYYATDESPSRTGVLLALGAPVGAEPPTDEDERPSAGMTREQLALEYDQWANADGNTPGYSRQKATTYGALGAFWRRLAMDRGATGDEWQGSPQQAAVVPNWDAIAAILFPTHEPPAAPVDDIPDDSARARSFGYLTDEGQRAWTHGVYQGRLDLELEQWADEELAKDAASQLLEWTEILGTPDGVDHTDYLREVVEKASLARRIEEMGTFLNWNTKTRTWWGSLPSPHTSVVVDDHDLAAMVGRLHAEWTSLGCPAVPGEEVRRG